MNDFISESIHPAIRISHDTTFNTSKDLLHVHDNGYEIFFFISGDVKFFFETSIYKLEPGDVLLIPPNTLHGYSVKNSLNYERIPLHIQQTALLTMFPAETSLIKIFQDRNHRILHLNDSAAKYFIEYSNVIIHFEKNKPYGCDILSHAYLRVLLSIIIDTYKHVPYTANNVSPDIIRNAIDYINIHLKEELTVQVIADALYVSTSWLTHLFKKHMGISVWNYVIIQRLLLARTLLENGKTVMEACLESGFSNYAHFNKAFSKTFNISPKKFQKDCQSNHMIP